MPKIIQFFKMLVWKRDMQKHADWFDKNQPAQNRFEENEEWLEELEDRIIKLEELNEINNK
jgi:hypothetical protein